MRRLAMGLLVFTLAAACGSSGEVIVSGEPDGQPGPAGDEPGDPSDAVDGFVPTIVDRVPDLRVFCGSVEFEERSLDLTGYPVFEGDLAAFLQEDFLPEYEAQVDAGLLDMTLYEIERTPDRIHLFGAAEDGSYLEIASDRIDGEWRMSTWGGCRPQIEAEGFGISELALDPANEPTPQSQALDLLVTERECASGLLPEGRGVSPIVLETSTTVDIVVLIEPTPGDATCPSNPSFPLTIDLAEPLGDRLIRNIAFEPPVVLG